MCKQMLAAKNFFRVDDLLVQIYNTEVEMAQDVAEITQKHLQQVLKQQARDSRCIETATQRHWMPNCQNCSGAIFPRISTPKRLTFSLPRQSDKGYPASPTTATDF